MANQKKAKQRYSIPNSIDVNALDMPFSLRRGSVGPKKPVTVGLILLIIFVAGLYAYLAQYFLKNEFGIIYVVGFSIFYWIFAVSMIRRGRTNERGYRWLMPTINYWFSGSSRFIVTRGHAGERDIMKLKFQIPVETWDEQSGLVTFTDGSVAYLIDVIGNGSRSLFQDDIDRIIGTFETYLEQLKLGTSISVVSRQASQDTTIQRQSLEEKRRVNANQTVDYLIARNVEMLSNFVETRFKSIHQYIVLRARNVETLQEEYQWLLTQYNEDLFRQMEMLKNDKLTERLRNFYNLT